MLPTQYEAFCLAILEALGSGLPVVTSSVPGARDAIVPGANGDLVQDPNNGEELASVLLPYLDPDHRTAVAQNVSGTVADYQCPLSWRGTRRCWRRMPAERFDEPPQVLLLTDADVFAGTEQHMLALACALTYLGVQVRVGGPSPAVLADRAAEKRRRRPDRARNAALWISLLSKLSGANWRADAWT